MTSRKVKKDTARQAFCKSCQKGVPLPHKCPIDGKELIAIVHRSGGM